MLARALDGASGDADLRRELLMLNVLRREVPRQQLGEPIARLLGDPHQYEAPICLRVEAVELGRLQQRVQHSSPSLRRSNNSGCGRGSDSLRRTANLRQQRSAICRRRDAYRGSVRAPRHPRASCPFPPAQAEMLQAGVAYLRRCPHV